MNGSCIEHRVLNHSPIGNHHGDYERTLSCRGVCRYRDIRTPLNEDPLVSQEEVQPQAKQEQVDKLIHLALPVRLIHTESGDRATPEMSCTYDIHPRGARLLTSREVRVGDFVTVERGRLKSVCQVIWTADRESPLRGQFTVECVESGRTPWEDELRQMEEQYLPVQTNIPKPKAAMNALKGTQNRRRGPRYRIQGAADLAEISGNSHLEGRLEQISECGCLITASDVLAPGTPLRLVLNMCDVSVALRGHVRYTAQDRAMGVEFQEIRQGDRPLLDYVLNQLKKPRREEFADVEVATDPVAVAG